MPSSSSGRTWAIKGVSDRTREAVHEAAQAEGLTVGECADRALARAAEEGLHPMPPAAVREPRRATYAWFAAGCRMVR